MPAWMSTLALFDKMCDCGHYAISAKYPQLLGLVDAIFETAWSPVLNSKIAERKGHFMYN